MEDTSITLEILEIGILVEALKVQKEIMIIENTERQNRYHSFVHGQAEFSRLNYEFLKLVNRVRELKSDASDK